MLPALRVLRRLQCDVPRLHADGSGALPVLSRLTALEELHLTSSVGGDYNLAFPPSLQVRRHPCDCMSAHMLHDMPAHTYMHCAA
jgi:hypothetical protein